MITIVIMLGRMIILITRTTRLPIIGILLPVLPPSPPPSLLVRVLVYLNIVVVGRAREDSDSECECVKNKVN